MALCSCHVIACCALNSRDFAGNKSEASAAPAAAPVAAAVAHGDDTAKVCATALDPFSTFSDPVSCFLSLPSLRRFARLSVTLPRSFLRTTTVMSMPPLPPSLLVGCAAISSLLSLTQIALLQMTRSGPLPAARRRCVASGCITSSRAHFWCWNCRPRLPRRKHPSPLLPLSLSLLPPLSLLLPLFSMR